MIEELIEGGFAYESDGDVYYRVRASRTTGGVGTATGEVQEQEPNPRKEDPRDFALWKTNKPDEDTWWESTVGTWPPRLARGVLVMSEKHLRTSSRFTVAASTSSSRTTRTS